MIIEDKFGLSGELIAGSFNVEAVIAEGGFALVYRAEHVAFRAPVALKCLKIPPSFDDRQRDEFIERFRQEVEILFHLSARIPEVVRPLHADAMTLGDGQMVPYFVMEWVDGQPLDVVLLLREERGEAPMKLKEVMVVLEPIANALRIGHEFKVPGGNVVCVAHCDLKPENILINPPDNPVKAKILDFGIAQAYDAASQNTSAAEECSFTPNYGSPEQWQPQRFGRTGPWTDVWGLALTMTECLTGQMPLSGEDLALLRDMALSETQRPTPRSLGADVSEAVEAVFAKALAVNPLDRYQTIDELWTALEQADRQDDIVQGFDMDAMAASPRLRAGSSSASDFMDAMEDNVSFDLDDAPLELADTEVTKGELFGAKLVAQPGMKRVPSLAPDSLGPEPPSEHELLALSSQPSSSPPPPDARVGTPEETEPTLLRRLIVPVVFFGLGVLITLVDMFTKMQIGPARLRWIGITITGIGLAYGFWKLVLDEEEGE